MAESCAEKTFPRTTIADIVTRASISRATFYKHFINKRECFDATVEAIAAELEAAASNALGGADSAAEGLRRAVAAVLDALVSQPSHARVFVLEAPMVDPALVSRYRAAVIDALGIVWGSDHMGADPSVSFGRAQVLIASYVASERIAELPELQRELVYIALLPFLGQKRALEHANLSPL